MSITLTNPINITQGASTLESDIAAAAMSIAIDFTLGTPIVVLTFKNGNVSGLSLIPGAIFGNSPVQVSIDLTTGKWAATTGQAGTLSGAALTSLLTTLKGIRNSAESFATGNAIIAGTQVAW